ncbi:MAG: ABC transporter permease [Cyclobacteriaceae bacterium]
MLKYAFRYLIRFRQFSVINILGLTLGTSAAFILLGVAYFESSYDNFHSQGDKIYRVLMHHQSGAGGSESYASTYSPIAKRLKEDFSEVTDYVRTYHSPSLISLEMQEDKISFNEDRVCFASESFFSFFSVPIIQGDKSGSLGSPDAAYISASASKRYFGDENPINKTITRNSNENYTIYGVFADPPLNTHLNFDFILSYNAYAVSDPENDVDANWSWWDTYYAYIKISESVSIQQMEKRFPAFMMKYRGDTWTTRGYRVELSLQPLSQIHYGIDDDKALIDDVSTIRKSNLYTFVLVAIFILMVAWINFVNLSTAQSFMRAKEVGVKKILGSRKLQLLWQFMSESLVTNGLALIAAIALTWAALPYLISTLDLQISIENFLNLTFLAFFVLILLAGALFSGYYPSLILLSHSPIKILKGNFSTSPRGNVYRNVLLIFQFSCTLFLVVSTLGVFKQMNFMKGEELGVNIDKRVTFLAPMDRDSTYDQRIGSFLEELSSSPSVTGYSSSSTVPGIPQEFKIGGVRRLESSADNSSQFGLSYIDEKFIDFFGLTILTGSNLDESLPADADKVLINESAARRLGYSNYEDAIGDQIVIPRGTVTIKGVIKDYHNESLKSDFEPSIFRFRGEGFKDHHTIAFATTGEVSNLLGDIESKWSEAFDGRPFQYFELDHLYEQQYETENNFGSLILLFSCVAILIACLGLYSLASFNLMRQRKELAVRKVLGAPISVLIISQYKKYALLVTSAAVLAIPLGFYFVQQWLAAFANKITLGIDLVIIPIGLIILITCVTITQIILKAVHTNPVTVIRRD